MKPLLIKIADWGLFIGTGLLIVYILIHFFNHMAVIQNLPFNMSPAEKQNVYNQLMK